MMNLNNLDIKIDELDNQVKELSGSIKILENQYADNTKKLSDLKELQITNLKGIELLNLIQKVTKDLIKDTFETITTKALQFIHQDDNYKFELEFGRRGQIPELNFNIKTPDMQESHDILQTFGGGSNDIVSLALRFVLLEVSKTSGFIFLDECEKHLDSPETLQKMIEFVKEIQKETKRQVFWITHKQEVVDSVLNPIIITLKDSKSATIKCSINNEQSQEMNIDKPKRGRKSKNATKD